MHQKRRKHSTSNSYIFVIVILWSHLYVAGVKKIYFDLQVSAEKGKKLENLGTVMTLYSRRTFSKESFQWTKCVVKYLYDTYAHLSFNMLAFLVEVLEKGPGSVALPVLSIIHCMLHYVDLASQAAQPINTELLRVISKYVEVRSRVHFKT